LAKTDLIEFAIATEGMSGRDLRDVCQQAERRWASKIIRGQAETKGDGASLPPIQEYIESAISRQKALLVAADDAPNPHPRSYSKKPQFDFM
jgi:SpoVK/Ycf46/Vps4 family AAA+-type ATPase